MKILCKSPAPGGSAGREENTHSIGQDERPVRSAPPATAGRSVLLGVLSVVLRNAAPRCCGLRPARQFDESSVPVGKGGFRTRRDSAQMRATRQEKISRSHPPPRTGLQQNFHNPVRALLLCNLQAQRQKQPQMNADETTKPRPLTPCCESLVTRFIEPGALTRGRGRATAQFPQAAPRMPPPTTARTSGSGTRNNPTGFPAQRLERRPCE